MPLQQIKGVFCADNYGILIHDDRRVYQLIHGNYQIIFHQSDEKKIERIAKISDWLFISDGTTTRKYNLIDNKTEGRI